MNNSISGSNLAMPAERYRFDFVTKKPRGDSFPYIVPRGYRSSKSTAMNVMPSAAKFLAISKQCRDDQVVLFSEWERSIGSYQIRAIFSKDAGGLAAWHFADYSQREAHMSKMIRTRY